MKKLAAMVLVLSMALALTACGGKKEEAISPDDQVFTGTLEEKKDFMVVAVDEDTDNAYIFQLDDGVKCEADNGDTVKITYTGDIAKADQDETLIATKIEKVK